MEYIEGKRILLAKMLVDDMDDYEDITLKPQYNYNRRVKKNNTSISVLAFLLLKPFVKEKKKGNYLRSESNQQISSKKSFKFSELICVILIGLVDFFDRF